MPDFSHAGYGGGGVAIPYVPVKAVVEPGLGKDRQRIQSAIKEVSKLAPGANGCRGAVLLRRGVYDVRGEIKIGASGVVLRGEGRGEDGTVLYFRGKKRSNSIIVQPRGARPPERDEASRVLITDGYVPVGARSFHVEDSNGLSVGDSIAIERPSTKKWIRAIGMDRIPARDDGRRIVQWKPGSRDIAYYRTIMDISGQRLTVNAPVYHNLDREFGRSFVVKQDLGGLVRNVGVESLRGVSLTEGRPTDHKGDERHPWTMVYLNFARDCWARNISALHYSLAAVKTDQYTLNVTVQNCSYLQPISRITGRRRLSFLLWGQLNLGLELFSEFGRHDFATGHEYSSGVVFLDSESVKTYASSEPHSRYATGILYDNVRFRQPQTDLVLALWNRGNRGTGHGWAAVNSVLWNCAAPESGVVAEKPPFAQNYAIGCNSATMSGNLHRDKSNLSPTFDPEDAHWEYWNEGPIDPQSLYRAQLEDRMGPEAVSLLSSR